MTGWHPAPVRMAFRAAFPVGRDGRNGAGGVPVDGNARMAFRPGAADGVVNR
jgi:hypothetical protein